MTDTSLNTQRIFQALLMIFAVSFCFFAIQSGDVLMYLALARDFVLQGRWPAFDPYLYSLKNAPLHVAHEYLSYILFYGAWSLAGYGGLIAFKALILSSMFGITLASKPRQQASSALWIALWVLAVVAGSFRFIERSSLFSDLFCVALIYSLLERKQINWRLSIALASLFLFWAQLHPGFPLGLAILAIWVVWNSCQTPGFLSRSIFWLLIPVTALAINPLYLDGALYPFRFALSEAQVLKHSNFEWFPSYSAAFRFTPEVIAFWVLGLTSICLIARERAWLSLRSLYILFSLLCATQAVRFIPWASFAMVLLVKPWSELQAPRAPALRSTLLIALGALLVGVSVKNFTSGYTSSSGHRRPGWGLDPEHFPIGTLEFLRAHPNSGRLYNAHDYGSYLVWMGFTPIFHHGFVTDMDFYANDVVGVFESQARFLQLAQKYSWTMLLVEKRGSYHYFFKILSPLTNWKIVAEDEASYLIYDLPQAQPSPP